MLIGADYFFTVNRYMNQFCCFISESPNNRFQFRFSGFRFGCPTISPARIFSIATYPDEVSIAVPARKH